MSTLDQWIADQSQQELATVTARFAACMNGSSDDLDALFAPDCKSVSQMRIDDIVGRENVVRMFRSWIEREVSVTFAELGNEPQAGDPCTVMWVRDSDYGHLGLGALRSYISLVLNDAGQIQECLAVSLTPSPHKCRRSGIFPGLTEEDLRQEREYVGLELPRTEDLELLLFVAPEFEVKYAPYRSTVAELAKELNLPQPQVRHLAPGEDSGPRLGVAASPTVVLTYREARVRLIEGMLAPDALRQMLAEALAQPAAKVDDQAEPGLSLVECIPTLLDDAHIHKLADSCVSGGVKTIRAILAATKQNQSGRTADLDPRLYEFHDALCEEFSEAEDVDSAAIDCLSSNSTTSTFHLKQVGTICNVVNEDFGIYWYFNSISEAKKAVEQQFGFDWDNPEEFTFEIDEDAW